MLKRTKRYVAALLAVAVAFTAPASAERSAPLSLGAEHPSVLVEEHIYAEGLLDFPEDAEIHISFVGVLPETALAIEVFNFEASSGRFAGRFTQSDAPSVVLRGKATAVVPIYLPVRRISEGQVLTADDLQLTHVPASSISDHFLRQDEDIIGKEAKRAITSGRPIPSRSLVEPRVIRRGDKVTILYGDGTLKLSAPGKALQDGAIGQSLRIVNLHSSKTISAKVAQGGIVVVEPLSIQTPNQN